MAVQAGLCLAWSETPEDTFYRNHKNLNSDTPKIAVFILKFQQCVFFLQKDADKGTQCQSWSDCSIRGSLIEVYTVCPDLSVQTLRTITYSLWTENETRRFTYNLPTSDSIVSLVVDSHERWQSQVITIEGVDRSVRYTVTHGVGRGIHIGNRAINDKRDNYTPWKKKWTPIK